MFNIGNYSMDTSQITGKNVNIPKFVINVIFQSTNTIFNPALYVSMQKNRPFQHLKRPVLNYLLN